MLQLVTKKIASQKTGEESEANRHYFKMVAWKTYIFYAGNVHNPLRYARQFFFFFPEEQHLQDF